MSSKAHQAYIALSEPMTSKVQKGSSLGSCPSPPNPHYNRPSCLWPWVESCLVGDKDKYLCREEITQPIQYLYRDQISLINSSDCCQKCLKLFFLPFFSDIIQSNFWYTLFFFYYWCLLIYDKNYSISKKKKKKKSNWFVNLILEIFLDSIFQVREEIFENVYHS